MSGLGGRAPVVGVAVSLVRAVNANGQGSLERCDGLASVPIPVLVGKPNTFTITAQDAATVTIDRVRIVKP